MGVEHLLIIAQPDGREIRAEEVDFDFEIGSEDNTFELSYSYDSGIDIPEIGQRVYIPYTEYGGIVGEIRSDTESGTVLVCGLTWRGLLQRHLICPDAGQGYYIVSGNVGSIITGLIQRLGIEAYFAAAASNVVVGTTRFRYTAADTGIDKMLATQGCKMVIRYDPELRRAVISAAGRIDYSLDVEMSPDGEMSIVTQNVRNGINHLIALGKGTLADRQRVDIYTNANGQVVSRQVLFGEEEMMYLYEDPSVESIEALREKAEEMILSLCNQVTVEANVEQTSKDMTIGDTVSGRDYVTGLQLTAPISGVICKRTDGVVSVEYAIKED